MNAKDRLLIFLSNLNIGQGAFEKNVGISNGYINNSKGSIGSQILNKISIKYPELNTEWILNGEGEMLKGNKAVVSSPDPEYKNSKQDEIDRLNRLVQSQQDTIHKLTELLYERKGVQRDAEVAGVV